VLRLPSARAPKQPRSGAQGSSQGGFSIGPGWVWVTEHQIGQWGQRRGLMQDDHVSRVLPRSIREKNRQQAADVALH
jgi:hypothetical protein